MVNNAIFVNIFNMYHRCPPGAIKRWFVSGLC
jgi:hypothetical protein